MQILRLQDFRKLVWDPSREPFFSSFTLVLQCCSTSSKSDPESFHMQSSCDILHYVFFFFLLFFDFWSDLIAFDDALSLIRTEQRCYTPPCSAEPLGRLWRRLFAVLVPCCHNSLSELHLVLLIFGRDNLVCVHVNSQC